MDEEKKNPFLFTCVTLPYLACLRIVPMADFFSAPSRYTLFYAIV